MKTACYPPYADNSWEKFVITRVKFDRIVPFDFEGLEIRELTPEALQSASIAAIDVPSGAAHRTARSSRSDKLYVCIEGRIAFVVNDQEFELEAMDVLHVPRGEWFSYCNAEDQPARLLLVHVPPLDLASEEFSDKDNEEVRSES